MVTICNKILSMKTYGWCKRLRDGIVLLNRGFYVARTTSKFLAHAAVFAATGLFVAPAVLLASLGSPSQSLSASPALAGQFTPATADPRLVAAYARVPDGDKNGFRFTPAIGAASAQNQGMTVVVRSGLATPEALSSGSIAAAVEARAISITAQPAPAYAEIKITPIAYKLGAAIGFNHFALPAAAPSKRFDIAALPKPKAPAKSATKKRESRFGADLRLGNDTIPGADPRLLNADRAMSVDVAGQYKLTKNLDVTAGVRLRQENDRLKPLTDDRQDSQAVYVGTRFKF
jgi:hypothetical protein